MTAWLVATCAMLPPLGVALAMCARGRIAARLSAAQLAGSVALLVLVAMTVAFQQASSIDLALALGLLTLPAILLFAVFSERWL